MILRPQNSSQRSSMTARATQNRAISSGLNSLQEYLRESKLFSLCYTCLHRSSSLVSFFRWSLASSGNTRRSTGRTWRHWLTLTCLRCPIFLYALSRAYFQMQLALILTMSIRLTLEWLLRVSRRQVLSFDPGR